MKAFVSVLIDLKDFIFEILSIETDKDKVLSLPQPDLTSHQIEETIVPLAKDPIQIPDLKTHLITQGNEVGFVCVTTAEVFQRAVASYDGVIIKLKYGDRVVINNYEGRFAHINFKDNLGWILKDNLLTNQTQIYPDLISGNFYDAKNSETIKLRKYIQDEFFAKDLFLPLQSEELVEFFLRKRNIYVNWPKIRPRQAGMWQQLLRGVLGISIGITPKSGSVVEYWKEDGTGFVGYTKSVLIDDSIVVAGVGRQKEGEYLEETLSKSEWQEYRPVWISVT